MIKTAIVILNFNGEKLLREFLPSVVNYSGGATIIVADNGSTDESVALLRQDFPQVQIIELPFNYGFCKGYNEALRQVKAEAYVLLNSDVAVTPGWLDPMLDLFEKDSSIAAIQPKILSYRQKNKFEYAGAGGGLIDSLGYPFCRGRIFDHIEEDRGQYDDTREVFWTSGACMVVRADVYHSLGGLDDDFFAHQEEIDLCWKIHRTGKRVMYCGASHVYHLGAGTLGYESPRKTFLNFRNNLTMIVKHYGGTELAVKFPVRILLDWLAAVVFLLKRHPGNAWAVMRAHAAFAKNLPAIFKKRGLLQSKWPTYPCAVIWRGSILYNYHIRKKKLFTPYEMAGESCRHRF